MAASPSVPGHCVKSWSFGVDPSLKPPSSFLELAATSTGIPSRVPSATSFIALIQVAMSDPRGVSRMMKCRMCSSAICCVVPSIGRPEVLCGSLWTSLYCSSRAPPWLVSSGSGWEMPIVREQITIRPIFSSGVIRETRSAARSAALNRQSSYGSRTPLPFRSRNCSPWRSRTGFTRAAMVTWSALPLSI